MSKLTNDLIHKGYLQTDLLIDAMSEMSRCEFVPREFEQDADADVPLPIGFGQTVSQPTVVAFMLELLDPKRDQKILDVGSGSGWTTAILSYVVGPKGKVIAIERQEKLLEFGWGNVDKFGFVKKGIASFHLGDGSLGFPQDAPFDRILVSAGTESVPEDLKRQLKIGGKMVIPIGPRRSIMYVEKKGEGEFHEEEYPGFAFVPMILGNDNGPEGVPVQESR